MTRHQIKLIKLFGVYVDHTLEDVPRVFYVGKGLQARVQSVKRNNHHTNISLKYGIKRELVFETDVATEAAAKEIELIVFHKTYVYGDDYIFGANYTRGGEGALGRKYVPTPEALRKQSEAQRGKKRGPWTSEQREKRVAGMRGKKHVIKDPVAYGKRCSEQQRKRMQDPEIRKQMGDVQRGVSKKHKGRKYTPEQRLARSEQLKAYWARKHAEMPVEV